MLASALTVSERVLILFLMISAGFVSGKTGAISKRGAQQINFILFYIVTPALIISSLQSMIGQISVTKLLIAGGFSVLCMLVSILVGMRFFPKSVSERKKVLRFACTYSNCGFMGLPLVQSVMGDVGVAYASMFLVVYNVFVWTHGYAAMSGSNKLGWKKIVANPGLIGIVLGFPLFAFSIHLPELLETPLDSFASLNTPLAMIVIGSYISRVNLKELFNDWSLYGVAAVRMILIPLVSFGLLYFTCPDKTIAATMLILSAAPSGANTAMFAALFGGDAKLASKSVAFTTLCSIITMPVFILLSGLL
ncbi:AEC family transporter [Caproiciproducens sp. LBM24188]